MIMINDNDDLYRCLLATPGLAHCDYGLLVEKDESLHCQMLDVKTVAPIRNRRCSRRSIWSKHRRSCVKLLG